ncbi:MAG TPA: hypothetical protein VK465_00700, partial [Fibrobacteria bacterium]|nr:hypothetical protein [Fibrobacteria bacterium]
LSLGEAEFLIDAPLNPYLKGFFTLSAGEEGVAIEEAYAEALRGLRFGLGLKAGQYRLGFGRLNAVHPHAYPFLETPTTWATLLPGGEEGWKEPAAQASVLLPTPGTWASTVSADVIRAAEFHPGEEEETRLGALARWSNAFLFGERAALEAGASWATGLDHVEKDLRGHLAGGDFKLKLYLPASSQLVLQGEGAWRLSHAVDSRGDATSEERWGFYAFADWRNGTGWNLGALYDQADSPDDPDLQNRAVTAFTGWSLMEESTVLRLAYTYFLPEDAPEYGRLAFQFLFSMGPHKPHRF